MILPFLVKLCNAIYTRGIFIEEWTKSVIVPLYKKGDCDDPNNSRGISLLSSLSSLLDLQSGQKKTSYLRKPKPASGKVIRQHCVACNAVITVKHILIESADLLEIRKKYFEERSLYSLFRNIIPEILF